MRILVAEDNPGEPALLRATLRDAGYGVDTVTSVADLLNEAKSARYDLLIVARRLRGGDGLEAVRILRSKHSSVPILITSFRGRVEDRIGGLDAGADDYLIRPFHQRELLARVRALLRRPPALVAPVLRAGNLEIDDAAGEVRCSGRVVQLRLAERRLLTLLVRRTGTVVQRSHIEGALAQCQSEMSGNAIEAQVSRLRKALKRAEAGVAIETVRSVGYLLRVEDEALALPHARARPRKLARPNMELNPRR
jgi:DNA-binding response OmpR family regulator